MIWAADANNLVLYVSPEWTTLTGQTTADVDALGWLNAVHAEDRDIVQATYVAARRLAKPYSQTYRLIRATGDLLWMYAKASPSIEPGSQRFLGYYGAIRQIDGAPDTLIASGSVDESQAPADVLAHASTRTLEALADQLLLARAQVDRALARVIDIALLEVGQRLALARYH